MPKDASIENLMEIILKYDAVADCSNDKDSIYFTNYYCTLSNKILIHGVSFVERAQVGAKYKNYKKKILK